MYFTTFVSKMEGFFSKICVFLKISVLKCNKGGSSPPKIIMSKFKSKRLLQAENDIEILDSGA